MTLTTPPAAPARTQSQTTFRTNMDAFLTWIVTFVSEMNALTTTILGYKTSAETAADTATSASAVAAGAANYKGEWSTLSGALAIPAAASHSGKLYYLTSTLADVTAKEPGVDAEWSEISTGYAGGTYTGAVTYEDTADYEAAATYESTATYQGAATYQDAANYQGAVTETEQTLTTTTPAFDPASGILAVWTLTGNSTPTDSLANGQFMSIGIDDGTGWAITWPSVTWVTGGGVAPTLETSGLTWVQLWKRGGTLYGARVGY